MEFQSGACLGKSSMNEKRKVVEWTDPSGTAVGHRKDPCKQKIILQIRGPDDCRDFPV